MKTPVFLTYGIITIDLVIAAYMFSDLKSLCFLIIEFPLSFVLGISGLYCSGHFIANWMSDLMKDFGEFSILIGIIGLFSILCTGVFFGSIVEFIFEIFNRANNDSLKMNFVNYIFNPMYLILLFGFIPTFITGGLLGCLIKKN